MLHVAALSMIWCHAKWMLGWCDEMYVRVCYDVIWWSMFRCMILGFMLMPWCHDAMIRWMLGDAMWDVW